MYPLSAASEAKLQDLNFSGLAVPALDPRPLDHPSAVVGEQREHLVFVAAEVGLVSGIRPQQDAQRHRVPRHLISPLCGRHHLSGRWPARAVPSPPVAQQAMAPVRVIAAYDGMVVDLP